MNVSLGKYHLQIKEMWGNAIYMSSKFKDDGTMNIHGCKSKPNVKDGDVIIVRSAQIDNFVVCDLSNVRYENNPRDMFFATATFRHGITVTGEDDLEIKEFIKCIEGKQ